MLKNQLEDLKLHDERLFGFYRGVVEDNKDPDMCERVKARIWGLHTDKLEKDELEGIPVDDLPWIEPVKGLIGGSISGFGVWSVPLQGSHVLIFFENGNPQQPRYMGTMPGIPTESPDTSKGFSDPDGTYPTEARMGQPDVHRLARGLSSETLVQHINDNLKADIPMAFGGTWNEPASSYAAEYPHNIVLATHGGMLMEVDSTPGNERYHIYHKSHTFIEVNKDGTIIIKNAKDKFELILRNNHEWTQVNKTDTVGLTRRSKIGTDDFIEVGNNRNEKINKDVISTISGNRTRNVNVDDVLIVGDSKYTTVTKDEYHTIKDKRVKTVEGDEESRIKGDKKEIVDGDTDQGIGGDLGEVVKGDKTVLVEGNEETTVEGNQTEEVQGNWTLQVNGTITINVDGTCDITSLGKTTITAATAEINGGGAITGVVNQQCICAFTGSPHPDASTTVDVSK